MIKEALCLLSLLLTAEVACTELYNYEQQGSDWGLTYPTCASGLQQSPIDLSDSVVVLSDKLMIEGYNYPNLVDYPVNHINTTFLPSPLQATLEVDYENDQFGYFHPYQFHFHSPSEHTVNSKQFDLEMHIVHVDNITQEAVVVLGFLFQISNASDAENTFLNNIQPGMFDPVGSNDTHNGSLNLGSFLSNIDFREFYNYNGSFTSPPCTEGVNWFVVKQVQNISQAQFDSFNTNWAGNANFSNGFGNNRLIQAANNRTVVKPNFNISDNSSLPFNASAYPTLGLFQDSLTFSSWVNQSDQNITVSNKSVALGGQSLSLKRGKLAAKIVIPITFGLLFVYLLTRYSPGLIKKCKASRSVQTGEKDEVELFEKDEEDQSNARIVDAKREKIVNDSAQSLVQKAELVELKPQGQVPSDYKRVASASTDIRVGTAATELRPGSNFSQVRPSSTQGGFHSQAESRNEMYPIQEAQEEFPAHSVPASGLISSELIRSDPLQENLRQSDNGPQFTDTTTPIQIENHKITRGENFVRVLASVDYDTETKQLYQADQSATNHDFSQKDSKNDINATELDD